jgi:hypothetical protein
MSAGAQRRFRRSLSATTGEEENSVTLGANLVTEIEIGEGNSRSAQADGIHQ